MTTRMNVGQREHRWHFRISIRGNPPAIKRQRVSRHRRSFCYERHGPPAPADIHQLWVFTGLFLDTSEAFNTCRLDPLLFILSDSRRWAPAPHAHTSGPTLV